MIPHCKWCDTEMEPVANGRSVLTLCPHCDRPCDDSYWNGVAVASPMDNKCPKCFTVMRRHYR